MEKLKAKIQQEKQRLEEEISLLDYMEKSFSEPISRFLPATDIVAGWMDSRGIDYLEHKEYFERYCRKVRKFRQSIDLHNLIF